MKWNELKIDGKTYTTPSKIKEILKSEKFWWLIDSEVENASIEIVNGTIIWNEGNFISGRWHYGIFKGGSFYGVWENGIWEGGNFGGKWLSGINLC